MAPAGFQHEVLFYEGEDDFLAGTVPYLRTSLEEGEAAVVAVGHRNTRALRGELGDDAAAVAFDDMHALGRNPARIIPFWRDAVEAHAGPDGGIRGIGEPIWPSRTPAELDECRRHERLLNLAFGDEPGWTLLCPYDSAALGDEVLDEAARCHPYVRREEGSESNAEHAGDDGWAAFGGVLGPLPAGAVGVGFERDGLAQVRALVAAEARRGGLDRRRASDLVTAASELAANSVAHGGGRGVVRIWADGGDLVVEVSDGGLIDEPLVGRRRPSPAQDGGRGLWIANRLCDLVQIRSGARGTSVRLRMAIDPSRHRGNGQSGSTGVLSFQ
jgi:anti-sigma regulatory factor (Ser/Thr protein kinase)